MSAAQRPATRDGLECEETVSGRNRSDACGGAVATVLGMLVTGSGDNSWA